MMSPTWRRILISSGIVIGVAIVALPAVIAYALLGGNNDASDAEIVRITTAITASPTEIATPPRATPSPPPTARLEPTREATPKPTQEPPSPTVQASPSPPVEEPPAVPKEEPPPPTPTPPQPTASILPVTSSIFVGPGVLFHLDGAEFDGLTVGVDGTARSRDFKIARIVWNWGDGTVEESWFPARHTYAQAGRYMLGVSVYDSRGIQVAGQSSPIDVAN
jgi:hypothetical protein